MQEQVISDQQLEQMEREIGIPMEHLEEARRRLKPEEVGDVGDLFTILAITAIVLTLASLGFTIYQFVTAEEFQSGETPQDAFSFRLRNSVDPTNPIPMIYGEVPVAGQFFFQDLSNIGRNNLLKIGVGISEGPIESITDIRVNGVTLDALRGDDEDEEGPLIVNDIFLGDIANPTVSGGGVSSIFAEPVVAIDFNDPIADSGGSIVRATARDDVIAIDIGIFAPQGIFEINKQDGRRRSFHFQLDIEYRKLGDTDWIEARRIRQSIHDESPRRMTFRVAQNLDPAKYEVRITHLSVPNRKDTSITDIRLDFIRELIDPVENKFAVGNFAYMGLSLEADNAVSGFPNIQALVKGLKTPTFATASSNPVIQWHDNPVWAVYDILTNTRYGLGNFIGPENIDLASFVDVAQFVAQTDSNGARKGSVNVRVGRIRPAIDLLTEILFGFGGFLQISTGGKVAIGVDRDEAPVQAFDEGNILQGTLKVQMASANETSNVNRLVVTFNNRDRDFLEDTFVLLVENEITSEKDVIERRISMPTVTSVLDVERQARRILNILRTNIRAIEFDASTSTVAARIGDVVTVSHPLTGWDKKLFRISSIEEEPDSTRKIKALEHNASVYTEEDTITTALVTTNAFNPFTVPGPVQDVQLSPEFKRELSGSVQTNLDVFWDPPDDDQVISHYNVYHSVVQGLELPFGTSVNFDDNQSMFGTTSSGTVVSGTPGLPNSINPRIPAGTEFTEIENVEQEAFVVVQIQPVTTAGVERPRQGGVRYATFVPTFSGQPSNVDAFDARIVGGDVFLTWSPVPQDEAPDLAGYEIRTEDSGFGTTTSGLVWRGLGLSHLDENFTSRQKQYFIRASNSSGLFSANSVSATAGAAPAALDLNQPTVEGSNIFLTWTPPADPDNQIIGYAIHGETSTATFAPSAGNRIAFVPGSDSSSFKFQTERMPMTLDFPVHFFRAATVDSLAVPVSDLLFGVTVSGQGEEVVTIKTASTVLSPPQGVPVGEQSIAQIQGAQISTGAVDRSSVEVSLRYNAFSQAADQTNESDLRVRISRGAGANPVQFISQMETVGETISVGQRVERTVKLVDFPGAPPTVPVDDGLWTYSFGVTQVSGSTSLVIESYEMEVVESR